MRSSRAGGGLIPSCANNPRVPLASRSELSAFLAGVEKRAFKQAVFAVRDEEAALDIVQDAMLRLAEKYGHLPVAELPALFHRIVQNAIRDWFRRQKVRSLWTTQLSSLSAKVRPPVCRMARRPSTPSDPIPVRTTPTLRGP